ncbi:MAG: chorismate-binding protein [Verrucomicrobiales bacterium]|nr:chorismate-binding protein [Verrucomicrobiales bacterium]MDF1786116.1 chorismate-binding protein [Verrucomicrobiales bacterium]
MNAANPDIAFLQLGPEKVVVGEGPFKGVSEAPKSGNAFYWNDFQLSGSTPWKIPARVTFVSNLDKFIKATTPKIEWSPVDRAPFSTAFRTLTKAFANGAKLEKMVPVVTERGKRIAGDLRSLASAALGHSGTKAQAYGRWDSRGGVIGATPESLLNLSDGVLQTMALAGTAPPADRDQFACDPKQIREHALVIDGIRASLGGQVEQADRGILELNGLLHFITRLRKKLSGPIDLNTLIRQLHPTPAVGFLPRSDKVGAIHERIRQQLCPPSTFAAPFGWWDKGTFQAVVTIRQLSWTGDNVFLPAGCGLIRESDLDSEWSELALKRSVVKQLLSLQA